jgi:hypothetical protein
LLIVASVYEGELEIEELVWYCFDSFPLLE